MASGATLVTYIDVTYALKRFYFAATASRLLL